MAANTTSGNFSSYLDPGVRIFQGLKPDIVAIQEFRYNSSASDENLRQLVDIAFGTNFHYYREPYTASGDIPNGIVSRWPIINAGSWDDSESPNRGFAWAQIDLPGTNDLYVVSVHLLTSSSSTRATEATQLKSLIQTNFPTNAWIIVGGDMNTDTRTEAAINTFKTFLSDDPKPHDGTDDEKEGTNASREKPYDYVLPSFSLTNHLTPAVVGSRSFPKGLVFDSRVYTPLTDVPGVQQGDSGAPNMQHMAVIKDFTIPVSGPASSPPAITTHPSSQTNSIGANVTFSVVATGAVPLAYQWLFFGTNLSGATTNSYSLSNIQSANAGDYSVVITNSFGSITSHIATLTVLTIPTITNPPQSIAVNLGENATFTVGASGLAPLSYQWRFNTMNISGATNTAYTRTNAQPADAGNYTVVITNASGSVTSDVASLTVNVPGLSTVIAQWDFNSVPPDGSTTTGNTTPSLGSGTATLVGGATATFATGDTVLDPAGSTDNTGWNTSTYPTQGTGNKTRGAQFNISTVGRQNIVVTWSSQASNTGSRHGRLQYTTDGTNFLDFPVSFTNTTAFTRKTNSLAGIPAVNDNNNFAIRLVAEFESTATGTANANYVAAGTSYGTSGTMRYDMVTVWGSDLAMNNPPATAPTLTDAMLVGDEFRFTLTGTTSSNYVLQATTNLSAGDWLPLHTNTAPFLYVETNVTNWPQRFYRGLVAP